MEINTPEDMKKQVIGDLEILDKSVVISETLKSLNAKANSGAREQYNKYGVEGVVATPLNDDGSARYTRDQFNALSDDDKKDAIRWGFEHKKAHALRGAVTTLRSNLEDIVKTGEGKFSSNLLKIANAKQVVENVDDKELMLQYAAVAAYEKTAKSLESGAEIDVEDKERLLKIFSAATSMQYHDKYVKRGSTDEEARVAAELSKIRPSENLSKEELARGAKQAAKEARDEVVKKFGKDYEQKVAKAVYGAIKKMLNSENGEDEQIAAQLFYKAEKGYDLGQRKFSEAYKKAA